MNGDGLGSNGCWGREGGDVKDSEDSSFFSSFFASFSSEGGDSPGSFLCVCVWAGG